MLNVIHLIVTILSDRHQSFDLWECNITGQPIWFHLLKLTFSTCFPVVAAQQWHGRDAVWGFGKSRWMVTEGGDWLVLTSHFYGSHKDSLNITATLCRLCELSCGLTCFETWPGSFSFDNMGPLNIVWKSAVGRAWYFPLAAFTLQDLMHRSDLLTISDFLTGLFTFTLDTTGIWYLCLH